MPIKPENRHRYPADWPAIRQAVLRRAGHRCEWPGCGARDRAIGFWRAGEFVQVALRNDFSTLDLNAADAATGRIVITIVLTVAHLDHVPEHCELSNLRAWCQRHHLAYDCRHHQATAYMTRRARACTLELFE